VINRKWIQLLLGLFAIILGISLIWNTPWAKSVFQPTPTYVSVVPLDAPTSTYTPTPTSTDTPTPTLTNTHTPTVTPTPTTTVTPTPTPIPDAMVNTEALNLRSGPGVVYDILGVLKRGDCLKVIGRNLAGDWLKVICPDEREGWILCSLLQVNVDVADVPVVQAPPTPTPLYTPTPTATATPELYPAPTLLEPRDREGDFTGQAVLKWQWEERSLEQDEL